jgi:hypothetical protein
MRTPKTSRTSYFTVSPPRTGGFGDLSWIGFWSERAEPDVSRRMTMYQQAEQRIVDQAPVLFTTHGLSYVLGNRMSEDTCSPDQYPDRTYMWLDGK